MTRADAIYIIQSIFWINAVVLYLLGLILGVAVPRHWSVERRNSPYIMATAAAMLSLATGMLV